MNLIIQNKSNIELTDFCNFIINKMQEYLPSIIDERKLVKFNEYLNNNYQIRFTYKAYTLSVKSLLISGVYNLVCKKHGNDYIIEIDRNVNIPNTYIKLIDIIKLVNYGNLSLQAYPIYDELMNKFANDLDMLYEQYINGDQ